MLTLDRFFEGMARIAEHTRGRWYVGSLRHPTDLPVIRAFHNGIEFQHLPPKKDLWDKHRVFVVDVDQIKPHWREVCPVEAYAMTFGFAPDRRPWFPARSTTYFDLAWRIGMEAPLLHRVFRAIDSDCEESPDDWAVRYRLLALLKPWRFEEGKKS